MRMRHSIACLLLLGGCDEENLLVVSETPVIPVEELTKPENLGGTYWSQDVSAGRSLSIVKWQWDKDKTAFHVLEDDDVEIHFEVRLAELPGSELYLVIEDLTFDPEGIYDEDDDDIGPIHPLLADGKVTAYGLLEHRDSGVYATYAVGADCDSSFAGQNVAYLGEVAAKHGFTIICEEDEDTAIIDGPLNGTGVLELFRDPAFLGAMKVTPTKSLLPMGTELPVSSYAVYLPSGRGRETVIRLVNFPQLEPGQRARPNGLAGSYYSWNASGESPDVQLDQLPDGQFEISGSIETRLSLLAFDEGSNLYAGIRHENENEAGDQEDLHERLLLVSKWKNGCWSFSGMQERPVPTLGEVYEARYVLTREAAARQRLIYKNGRLSGALDGDSLLALFKDGQFTTGLQDDFMYRLCPRPFDEMPSDNSTD